MQCDYPEASFSEENICSQGSKIRGNRRVHLKSASLLMGFGVLAEEKGGWSEGGEWL